MNIVADTNIFLAVALNEDEKSNIIAKTAGCDIYAPEILPYEIGNALSAMVKRRQVQASTVTQIYDITQKIPVTLAKVDISRSLAIAVKNNIYTYDAYFIQCALNLSSPLLTLDTRMIAVANDLSITTMDLR